MKIVIVEDEHLAATYLTKQILELETDWEVEKVIASVKSGIVYFKNSTNTDLIFCDIQLSDGKSFEIFEQVEIQTPVIFTTAYNEYALKAFETFSLDYLLKPISNVDLNRAIQKFKKITPQVGNNINFKLLLNAMQKTYKDRFMVKSGTTLLSIDCNNVMNFKSEDGAVLLTINGGKRFIVDYTIEQLEKVLNPKFFFRINRRTIVNIESVLKAQAYFNGRLKIDAKELLGDDYTLISRERVNDFKEWLG